MNVPVHPPVSQLNQTRSNICGLYVATILKSINQQTGLLIQERKTKKNTNECTAVEIKTLTREQKKCNLRFYTSLFYFA